MVLLQPRSKRTDNRWPYTTLVRSRGAACHLAQHQDRRLRRGLRLLLAVGARRHGAESDQADGRARGAASGGRGEGCGLAALLRSEEHTSELQSLMRISYAVFCLKKKTSKNDTVEPITTIH